MLHACFIDRAGGAIALPNQSGANLVNLVKTNSLHLTAHNVPIRNHASSGYAPALDGLGDTASAVIVLARAADSFAEAARGFRRVALSCCALHR